MKGINFFKIAGLITVLLVAIVGFFAYILIARNELDARVINSAGYIRGETQRMIKLHISGHEDQAQELIAGLDQLMVDLVEGNKARRLPPATDAIYISQMLKVSLAWQELKQKIIASSNNQVLKDSLIHESEKFFVLTDDAVLAAQHFSEKKIQIASYAQLFFLVSELIIVFALGLRLIRRLEAEEASVAELQKFKAAVDGVSEQIMITDKEGKVVYVNNAVEAITGYPANAAMGMKAGVLWGKHMEHGFYDGMWKTIKVDRKVFFGTIKNQRKNGEFYDAAISVSPILDKDGEPVYFVSIERDISKDVALDRAKTEFVSLASHQLRTPLTAISWYTELLLNGEAGKLTKKQEEYLNEVAHGNRRMVDLVNSLLDVSRMELGTFIVNPEPTDICALMEETLKDMKPLVEKGKIDLKYSCAENIPRLMLDPKLTKFIFQNLLSNAVKYTEERGIVKVEIELKKADVLISFADTGLGIPKRQQGEIFKKFFRADNVRAKDTEGTGLGLYLVKTILDTMGAKVWFESEEKVGSTFYVSIPLTGVKGRKGEKSIISV